MLNLKQNIDITNLSQFKTKATASYYYEINEYNDLENLKEILTFIKSKNLEYLIISWWTNMLFAFDNYDWLIIYNKLSGWKFENNILETYSSENISDIAISLEKNYNQSLFHRFIWLPGSVWWAVVWNAGCFGLEIENNFLETEVLDMETFEIKTFSKSEMDFEYRSSLLKKENKYYVIKTTFDLSKKVEKYHSDVDNIEFRENKQPKWNTCGSFFKNPNREYSAWKLIEEIWFKGKNINWALFSHLHANFLMNDWTATYNDLLDLVDIVQKKVKINYDIQLIPEVRIFYNK